MNKQELHNKLANITESVTITKDEFIEVYGDMRTIPSRKDKTKTLGRADILAGTYNLKVTQDGDNYTFVRG
jgi:hypothetical protein